MPDTEVKKTAAPATPPKPAAPATPPKPAAPAAAKLADEAPKERKSIVPAGWKSKDDALKQFIDKQAAGKDGGGFEYPAFFQLCRKNGIAEDQVKRYEDDIKQEKHGAKGRAKMTLRNMLDTIARKNGKLVGLDGAEHPITLAPRALAGAAAKQAEKKAETDKAAA